MQYARKRLDKKTKIIFKIYDVKKWNAKRLQTYCQIYQKGNQTMKPDQLIEYSKKYFSLKIIQKMRQRYQYQTSKNFIGSKNKW